MTLSPKHLQVRDYIVSFQAEYGRKPMWKEIMSALKIGSSRTLSKYLDRLQKAGELKQEYVAPKVKVAGA